VSDDNLVWFPGTTTQPVPVERVLDSAKHLKRVLVLGENEDGEFYAAGSTSDLAWGHFMCARFQHWIMTTSDDE
jgi:hypothetical protein